MCWLLCWCTVCCCMQFGGIQPVMQGLLSKLQQVNATVIALTTSMEAAHGNLVAANDNMVSMLCTPQMCVVYVCMHLKSANGFGAVHIAKFTVLACECAHRATVTALRYNLGVDEAQCNLARCCCCRSTCSTPPRH
jgi:hypothetical protein